MSDWLYYLDSSPPLSSTVGYYSPWHPGGLLLTRQRRRSSSTSFFRCQNYMSRMPWNWRCSPTRTSQISDWGASSSALPEGTVKAMKAHLGAFLLPKPPPPSCHDQCQKQLVDELVAASLKAATKPVDDLLSTKMNQLVAAATKPATRGRPPAMVMPSQSLAKKCKQIINRLY